MKNALTSASVLLAILLSGCGTTPPAHYYLLSSDRIATSTTDNEKAFRIGIAPIKFPAYLDRNKIVIMTSNNTLQTAEYHRWAEPLDSNFARVLTEDLVNEMPNADVYTYPLRPGNDMDVAVHAQVLRFDADSRNIAHLGVRWELTDRQRKKLAPSQTRDYQIPASNGEYESLVEALSACVHEFSRDLAASVRQTEVYGSVEHR